VALTCNKVRAEIFFQPSPIFQFLGHLFHIYLDESWTDCKGSILQYQWSSQMERRLRGEGVKEKDRYCCRDYKRSLYLDNTMVFHIFSCLHGTWPPNSDVFYVMVLQRRLKALKLLSASAEVALGTRRTNFSTSQYSPRVSWTIAQCTSSFINRFSRSLSLRLKSCSWSFKSLTSSSVYAPTVLERRHPHAVPESSICSINLYLLSPMHCHRSYRTSPSIVIPLCQLVRRTLNWSPLHYV